MSSLPSSATHMAQATQNGLGDCNSSFHTFFDCWMAEQDNHLQELVSAAKENEGQQSGPEVEGKVQLAPLVERVIHHYEHYYMAKSRWAHNNILSMFRAPWLSSLERAFLWVGGWRPTMAFHLLYSKAGLQLEARLSTCDLGNLSHSQLLRVDELHKSTLLEEKEITEKLAKKQETVADPTMVELTHVLTKMIRVGGDVVGQEGRLEAALAIKEEGLVGILEMADELRMKTLKGVIDILSPIQGVYFLIAAAELHLRVHDWGKKRDAGHHHQLDGDVNVNGNGHHRE